MALRMSERERREIEAVRSTHATRHSGSAAVEGRATYSLVFYYTRDREQDRYGKEIDKERKRERGKHAPPSHRWKAPWKKKGQTTSLVTATFGTLLVCLLA